MKLIMVGGIPLPVDIWESYCYVLELPKTYSAKIEKIRGFILNVYVPIFASVNMKPRVPDASNIST